MNSFKFDFRASLTKTWNRSERR